MFIRSSIVLASIAGLPTLVASPVVAESPAALAPRADTESTSGVVDAIDLANNHFTVTIDGKDPHTFLVNAETEVTLDGAKSTIEAAVKVGRSVTVHHDTRIARRVEVTTG